jgi:hypothetical protein
MVMLRSYSIAIDILALQICVLCVRADDLGMNATSNGTTTLLLTSTDGTSNGTLNAGNTVLAATAGALNYTAGHLTVGTARFVGPTTGCKVRPSCARCPRLQSMCTHKHCMSFNKQLVTRPGFCTALKTLARRSTSAHQLAATSPRLQQPLTTAHSPGPKAQRAWCVPTHNSPSNLAPSLTLRLPCTQIEVASAVTCVDIFTGLPIPFTLRGLANNVGNVAITPASLLTAASVNNNPRVTADQYTTSFIGQASLYAYSRIGAMQYADSPLPMGIVDPLRNLRDHSASPAASAVALSAYAADVQYAGLANIGGSFLAQVVGTTLDQAVSAISMAVDALKGYNTTSNLSVRTTLSQAAIFLAFSVNKTVDLTTRLATVSAVAELVATSNSFLAEQIDDASVPWSSDAPSHYVDIAGVVMRLSTISGAQQTIFSAAAVEAAKQNATAPITALFASEDALIAAFQSVKVNYAAILKYFGISSSPSTEVTVTAIGSVINCPVRTRCPPHNTRAATSPQQQGVPSS